MQGKKIFFPVIPLAKVGGEMVMENMTIGRMQIRETIIKQSHRHAAHRKILIEVNP